MNSETVYRWTALKRERGKIFANNMTEIITTFLHEHHHILHPSLNKQSKYKLHIYHMLKQSFVAICQDTGIKILD